MLVFYTWLREKATGIESALPIVTDYFVGDVGDIVKNDHNEEFVVTDFTVEELRT